MLQVQLTGAFDEFRALFVAAADNAVSLKLDAIFQSLATLGIQQERIMATLQEVLDTIAAERAQVAANQAETLATIQALRDQIAAGNGAGATPAQLDQLISAVQDIFTPTPVAPAPPPAVI